MDPKAQPQRTLQIAGLSYGFGRRRLSDLRLFEIITRTFDGSRPIKRALLVIEQSVEHVYRRAAGVQVP